MTFFSFLFVDKLCTVVVRWAAALVLLAAMLSSIPLLFSLALAQTAPWPMQGQGASHASRSAYSGPTSSVALRWRFQTRGAVGASPVIDAEGTVYIGSFDGHLYAISNATGLPKWAVDLGAPVTASACLAGGVVYAPAGATLFALTASSGAERWRFPTGGTIGSPTLGGDGSLYFGSGDTFVYKLSSSAELLWTHATGLYVTSAPALANGTVYIGGGDGFVTALSAQSGALQWRARSGGVFSVSGVPMPAGPLGTPAVSANGATVFAGCVNGVLYAFAADTGALRFNATAVDYWELDLVAPPALAADGAVVFGDRGLALRSFDGATGAPRWSNYLGNYVWGGVAIGGDGTIYAGCDDGNFSATEGASGRLLWKFPTGYLVRGGAAIGGDGAVYFGSYDGAVYALGAGGGASLPAAAPAAAAARAPPFVCTTDWDCTLSGACVGGACACDKPWTGPTCAELKLAPAPPSALTPFLEQYPANQTWGCAPFPHPDGRRTCFYFDWIVGNYSNKQQVIPWSDKRQGSLGLACALDPLGPYSIVEEVAVPFREDEFDAGFLQNSLITRMRDGSWVLAYTTQPAYLPRTLQQG